MTIKRATTSKRNVSRRHSPYILNPLPGQVEAMTNEWRRKNATVVETEVLKPESLLPVTTGSSGRSPICFTIKSIPHSRVDGNNIFIETTFNLQKLVGSVWSNVDTDDEVMPVGNTYCSMFEDLTVGINGVMAENSQREFAISRYLQNVLFTTEQDRKTWMTDGLLALAKQNPEYVAPAGDVVFPGTSKRRGIVEHGRPVTLYGKLLSHVLACSEPLPDNVDITIKLFPAKSETCIVTQHALTPATTTKETDEDGKTTTTTSTSPSEYRIQITDCSLYIPRITTKSSPNVDRAFTFTNWKTLAYTHQSGQTNFKKDIAIGETLPQKAMVVFLTENAYNGDWEKSKLAFGPHNVSNVLMKCNQKHLPFINGYNLSPNSLITHHHTAYTGLVTELGARNHAIENASFHNNYAIFGFDCTPNKTGSISLDTPLKGALELSVTFATAPTTNLMVLVLLIHDGKFIISKNGTFNHL